MKRIFFGFTAAFLLVLASCSGSSGSGGSEGAEKCSDVTVEDWDTFLGIDYGTNERDLEDKIGKFTGGEYTADSTAFVYYFNRVERVPVSVWVNGATGDVETIFIEVLSYEDNFDQDVENAVEEFKIDPCESRFLGMQQSEVEKIMGEPVVSETLDEGVKSISYDSEGFEYSVNFKFYPEQGNKCTSISLNWFY
ncbi:MAG: hypothetical protein MI810_09575 [Flavobacteriales bacterium]|nr:hypothetical protein [Flavobacteriales bacterium]